MGSNKSSKPSSARVNSVDNKQDSVIKEMQNANLKNILSLKIKDRLNVTQIQLLKNKNKTDQEGSPL